ncbi:hypothetical protein [Pseudohongiella spirulinae]|uniref:Type II secretion system protein G n=1 Tax=Pseudohongiella spirulinae TaxID=1249552 RepID=A0A0S2KH92_9GAMM|nr:hypothetical protein [Pseudohongiella spirulinae]ALO47557.1 hypothetical protein PS2015_2930 [Pseudohongiella spirulinae]
MISRILTGIVFLLLAGVMSLLALSVWPEPDPEDVKTRHDQQRIEHLNAIIEHLHSFRNQQGRLPVSLQELSNHLPRLQWRDPQTDLPFEYQLIRADVYSLCGVFETSTNDGTFGSLPGFNRHDQGRHCVYRTFEP